MAATTTIGGVTFRNGQIPATVLTLADDAGHLLQPATSTALRNMSAAMQAAGLGALTLTAGYSAYRSLADQAYMIRIGLTTIPAGQSEHGLALAVDLYKLGGFHTARYLWLAANAYRYGFSHPYWAREGGPLPEFWHWQHDGKTTGPTTTPTPVPADVPTNTPEEDMPLNDTDRAEIRSIVASEVAAVLRGPEFRLGQGTREALMTEAIVPAVWGHQIARSGLGPATAADWLADARIAAGTAADQTKNA